MPVPEQDYRFTFPRNISAVYPRARFRFAGIEYVVVRFKTEGPHKKVRAALAIEPSEDAPELGHLGERDPEGTSWQTPAEQVRPTLTADTLSSESIAELTRRLNEELICGVGMPAEYVHGPALVENIAAEPDALGPQIGDVVTIEPAEPGPQYSEFMRHVLGNPWAGLHWTAPKRALPLTERRALTDEERLFLFRNVARIEAEIVYLRQNSHTVCKVFKETERASLGYTTALEIALISVARELEDRRRGDQMFKGIKTAAELAVEAGSPSRRFFSPAVNEIPCPACGTNLRSPTGGSLRVDLDVDLNGRSFHSDPMCATIHEGICRHCQAELDIARSDGSGSIHVHRRQDRPFGG